MLANYGKTAILYLSWKQLISIKKEGKENVYFER